MTKAREEVQHQDKWNVEAIFPNRSSWENEMQKWTPINGKPFQEITKYQNRLKEGKETLKSALETLLSHQRAIEKLETYAHLKNDENIANDLHKSDFAKIQSLSVELNEACAWFEPELLSLPDEVLKTYLNAPSLKEYRFFLEKILLLKKHTLSKENEELLALSQKPLSSLYKTFSALTDADFVFGEAEDSQGKKREITHGLYGLYIRDRDRKLRENAFKTYHGKYAEYENTLCELLQGQVQKNRFIAKARNFSSCLEAALKPNNIDVSVYHSLIQSVNAHLGSLHNYMRVRKKLLKLDALHLYDLYVPVTESVNITMNYEDAEKAIIESVAPLGKEYQAILSKGLLQDRWVDRYENKNKRSGGYSSGSFDTMPYILMNYKELLRDVFTLAHEAGHSMHSYLSRTHQPYHYSFYSIFVAEVASTFNEELLMKNLLQKLTSKEEKIFLINQKIEDIRGTLFRQSLFAEFELLIHEFVEKNIPLTPKLLKEEYQKLNAKYFGKEVIIDPEGIIEWARIPHFYYNFYVYQYATGISAALALSSNVLNGKDKEREAYLNFLKGGSSKYPIDLLKAAGCDMRSQEPVTLAIQRFDQLVGQLEELAIS